jgi:hypothetical protein
MLKGVAFCSTLINVPFTHATNQLSWESPNSYTARIGQIVKWIAAPADRVIQAILFPLFILVIQIQRIASSTTYKKFIWNILVTPISLAIGLLGSALFVAAGIIQCFFPYKVFYGIWKGKEVVYEYEDIRHELQQHYQNQLITLVPAQPMMTPAALHAEYINNPRFEPYGTLLCRHLRLQALLRIITNM